MKKDIAIEKAIELIMDNVKETAKKKATKKAVAKKVAAAKKPAAKKIAAAKKPAAKKVAANKKAPAKKVLVADPLKSVSVADRKIAKEQYGKRVKELRQACGLTQSDLSKALGVTPGYISNVENNRTAMSLHILIYFAQLTGQTLDSLVGELEPAYKQSAIDKKINGIVSKLSNKDKEKLVKMLSVWSK